MKKTITWIMLADGAKAKIMVNEGPGKGLELLQNGQFDHTNKLTHELMTDKQGRAFESANSSRHAMEPKIDPQEREKLRFADSLVRFLSQQYSEGAFDRLVLVAPAKVLGDLRELLPENIKPTLKSTISKDYLNTPQDKLVEYLGDTIAL